MTSDGLRVRAPVSTHLIGRGRVAQALGVRVVATRRTTEAASRGLGETYPPDGLLRLLGESDYVALTVPLTQDATG